MQLQNYQPIHLFIAVLAIFSLVAASLTAWMMVRQTGYEQVEVLLAPRDAVAEAEFGSITNGLNRLPLGRHEFTVSRDGFRTAEITFEVTAATEQIALTIEPSNQVGEDYINQNPDINLLYENAEGINSRNLGSNIQQTYPSIDQLPIRHYSRESVYSIVNAPIDSAGVPGIAILNTSSRGRSDALKWLRDNQFDLARSNIQHHDYVSPLIDRTRSERGY